VSPPLWSALQAGSFPWAARPLPPVRHPPSRRTVGSWVHRELRACHAISTTHKHHTREPGFTTARPQETSIGPDGARVTIKVELERALAKVPEVKPVSAGSFGGADRERRLDVRDWGDLRAWAAEVANAFDAASAQEPSTDGS
jgi:hypothetical protein